MTSGGQAKPRARGLGVPFDGTPGPLNAITDVAGVSVGHVTLISGEGPLVIGRGPVRTGVTGTLPHPDLAGVCAGWAMLNGAGEMTGTHLIDEWGCLFGPVMTTNTYSVGIVRDAVASWAAARVGFPLGLFYSLPVVAECFDGEMSDILGRHVKEEHVVSLLDVLIAGGGVPAPVEEGNVGGGTGMQCHEFKGGIGTASRRLDEFGGYTIGALVQTNEGVRHNLTIAGVPVGREIADLMPEELPLGVAAQGTLPAPSSSIIVTVATDAPLLPDDLDRLAKRAALGVGLIGGRGEATSGDLFIAFSTAYAIDPAALFAQRLVPMPALSPLHADPLLNGVVQATEEAIVNALVAA